MQRKVLSFVDNPHPATAQFFDDSIVGNGLPDHEWHGNSGRNLRDAQAATSTAARPYAADATVGKMFEFCGRQRVEGFDAVFAWVWMGGGDRPPETGLRWCPGSGIKPANDADSMNSLVGAAGFVVVSKSCSYNRLQFIPL